MSKIKKKLGILVDAKSNRLTQVFIEDYKDIQRIGGYNYFDAVSMKVNGKSTETLYVDDEGLINGTSWGFELSTADGEPRGRYFGNGVVLGTNKHGESVDTALTLEDAAKRFRCFVVSGGQTVWLAKNIEIKK